MIKPLVEDQEILFYDNWVEDGGNIYNCQFCSLKWTVWEKKIQQLEFNMYLSIIKV